MESTMPRMRVLLAATLLAITCVLASCASPGGPGITDSRALGVPEGVQLGGPTEGPFVVAYDDGSVDVVTQGSGSCPPTASAIEIEADLLVVTFEPSTNDVCTADIAPTTHSFSADRVGGDVPDTARIIYSSEDAPIDVDVIRG